MTVRERRVPCSDCEEWKQTLTLRNLVVIGCDKDPADSNFCVIRFEEPDSINTSIAERTSVLVAESTNKVLEFNVDTLTPLQIKTAQAIVNLFETGEVLGDYGAVTVISGDTGHLTYGRSQTTLGSGNLSRLLRRYCSNPGARFRGKLEPYLDQMEKRDFSLDSDNRLHNVLRACADDRVMRDVQDLFFDEVYWRPAVRAAQSMGILSPLGIAVVYDSIVHGSWNAIRERTNEMAGTLSAIGEKQWIAAYVKTRRNWLETHRRADLRATVYRMDAFMRLIEQGYWGLELPLVVRGKEISESSLAATPPGCYDGPQPGTRPLTLQSPLYRGLDVRLLQLGLSEHGIDIKADGVFGQASFKCVKEYQAKNGLPANGVADITLITKLTI
jgi:chitosanase